MDILGSNYPMGPFELMDLTGVDIVLHVTESLYKELTKENKWSAPLLLSSMNRAAKLGGKVGQAWYKYLKKFGLGVACFYDTDTITGLIRFLTLRKEGGRML